MSFTKNWPSIFCSKLTRLTKSRIASVLHGPIPKCTNEFPKTSSKISKMESINVFYLLAWKRPLESKPQLATRPILVCSWLLPLLYLTKSISKTMKGLMLNFLSWNTEGKKCMIWSITQRYRWKLSSEKAQEMV